MLKETEGFGGGKSVKNKFSFLKETRLAINVECLTTLKSKVGAT